MKKNERELIPVEQRKRVITVDSGRKRRRRRKGFSIETIGYALEVLGILIVLSIGVGIFLVYSHNSKIKDAADKAVVELRESQDGTCLLDWSAVGEADVYHVEVSARETLGGDAVLGENKKVILFQGDIDGTSCRLPDFEKNETLNIKIELIKRYTLFGKERERTLASTERAIYPGELEIRNLTWDVDPDTRIVSLNYEVRGGDSCSIYVMGQDGSRTFLKTVDGNSAELDFNGEEELWVPENPQNPCTLTIVPGRIEVGLGSSPIVYYGGESGDAVITWEDFVARDIHLSLNMMEDCICYLEWDEADVDTYEVQMREGGSGEWVTLKTVSRNGERTYTSTRLEPGVKYGFRVKAVKAGAGEYEGIAFSKVEECEAQIVPMYCTVWPVKDLDVYSSPDKSEKIGRIKVLDAYCVTDVRDDECMFGIKLDGMTGYIDSNYCMINLTEYVGDNCHYDITNSYDSLFMAHGFEIPGLTGQVISGFEHVRLADGSFLVPLLYPTAKSKLLPAMDAAREKGYKLKIYESFRPYKASAYMFSTATRYQYTTLPEYTYSGEVFYDAEFTPDERVFNEETGEIVTRRKTYWELMQGSTDFQMTEFVSAGTSRHNLGVAMDLTLEQWENGYEEPMQTTMHDLSHFSARSRNTELAVELNKIMKAAGFNDLRSEWWHFQDDESRIAFNLPSVQEGVTPECWMENGFGRRYRDINGIYVTNCVLEIDGQEYTFDTDGYVQE